MTSHDASPCYCCLWLVTVGSQLSVVKDLVQFYLHSVLSDRRGRKSSFKQLEMDVHKEENVSLTALFIVTKQY